jgi:hypothetical protein
VLTRVVTSPLDAESCGGEEGRLRVRAERRREKRRWRGGGHARREASWRLRCGREAEQLAVGSADERGAKAQPDAEDARKVVAEAERLHRRRDEQRRRRTQPGAQRGGVAGRLQEATGGSRR